MTCALLTIGTELTRGELDDTNAGWLARKLTDRGYLVTEIATVDDDDKRIVAALSRLSRDHKVVISTGGLGPTTDDRTSACVAAFLGLPLVRDEEALASIKELFLAHGVEMSKGNEKQADFPQGAEIIENLRGSAPGFQCTSRDCRLFFLPGVPAEMRPMFDGRVLSSLPPSKSETSCIRLRSCGLPESEVNDRLAGLEEEYGITIGYRASLEDVEVKVLAQADNSETSCLLAEEVALIVEERLGAAIYARGEISLAGAIGELLSEAHLTLALAESCTGGLVSELITKNPGASAYYKGGVCSYSNSVKSSLLGVSEQTLSTQGAVSEACAREMAMGARKALDADYSLAITGLAGPGGGSKEKPVGLVHFAVAGPQGVTSHQKVFRGTRGRIQRRAASVALWELRKALLR